MTKIGPPKGRPQIERVEPKAAITGGEIAIHGHGLAENGRRPRVRFGELAATLLLSSPNRLVVRVPEGAISGELTVDTGEGVTPAVSVALGIPIAENIHPVANPALDAAGNIYTTFSGSRGQKVPVSLYKIDTNYSAKPFLGDLMNATAIAFDRAGQMYVSSRHDGAVYRVAPNGTMSTYAEGMGIATGIAFDRAENL